MPDLASGMALKRENPPSRRTRGSSSCGATRAREPAYITPPTSDRQRLSETILHSRLQTGPCLRAYLLKAQRPGPVIGPNRRRQCHGGAGRRLDLGRRRGSRARHRDGHRRHERHLRRGIHPRREGGPYDARRRRRGCFLGPFSGSGGSLGLGMQLHPRGGEEGRQGDRCGCRCRYGRREGGRRKGSGADHYRAGGKAE